MKKEKAFLTVSTNSVIELSVNIFSKLSKRLLWATYASTWPFWILKWWGKPCWKNNTNLRQTKFFWVSFDILLNICLDLNFLPVSHQTELVSLELSPLRFSICKRLAEFVFCLYSASDNYKGTPSWLSLAAFAKRQKVWTNL